MSRIVVPKDCVLSYMEGRAVSYTISGNRCNLSYKWCMVGLQKLDWDHWWLLAKIIVPFIKLIIKEKIISAGLNYKEALNLIGQYKMQTADYSRLGLRCRLQTGFKMQPGWATQEHKIEQNDRIPFLDILIKRNRDNSFSTSKKRRHSPVFIPNGTLLLRVNTK